MLAPRIRLALIVVSFSLGAYRVVVGDYSGLVLFLAAAYLCYGYFREDTVSLAFREVAHGRMAAAATLLDKIQRPERLISLDRGYFELASGLVCASRAENQRAEKHLELALANALRTENDRALAEAVLSQLLLARGARDDARRIIAQAITRKCRPAIAQRIKSLHDDLSGAGP